MELVRRARRFARAGLQLTLIDPAGFWYSGAAAGVLSGASGPERAFADAAALAGVNGVRIVRGRVARIDLDAGEAVLDGGAREAFHYLSLNTGSRAGPAHLIDQGATPVKPVSNYMAVRERMESAKGRLSIAIVGAGSTGVEAACGLAVLSRDLGSRPNVTLIDPEGVLAGAPERARREAEAALKARGVSLVRAEARSLRTGPGGQVLELDRARAAPCDLVLAAGGLSASLPDGLDDRLEDQDGLPVDGTLRWRGDARVFAVGDCAAIMGAPRPKLGVFGVKAAPVLMHNLIAAATGRASMKRYTPQSRWLSILDLAEGEGLAIYGGLARRGPLALRLKRAIDARFVNRYRS